MPTEPTLFTFGYKDDSGKLQHVYVLHWVDDLLIGAPPDSKEAARILKHLNTKMTLTGGQTPSLFCGIEVTRTVNGDIKLSQRHTIDQLVTQLLGNGKANSEDLPSPGDATAKRPPQGVKPTDTPLPQSKQPLSKEDGPTPAELEHRDFVDVQSAYATNLGLALWIANQTRPDIAQAVSTLARFTSAPGKRHRDALKHLARYLSGTRNLSLHYRRSPQGLPHNLEGWTDADWGNCLDTRRSTNGCIFKLNGGVVDYFSSRQAIVAMSTYESELISLCAGSLAAVHLRRLLAHMGHTQPQPTAMFVDNTAAVAQSNSDVVSKRARHIDFRTFKLRELVLDGQVITIWVDGRDNISDLLTKNVTKPVMQTLRPRILSPLTPTDTRF
jgi:hypothetical protein